MSPRRSPEAEAATAAAVERLAPLWIVSDRAFRRDPSYCIEIALAYHRMLRDRANAAARVEGRRLARRAKRAASEAKPG